MASKTKVSSTENKRDPFAYFGGIGDLDGGESSDEGSENEEEETKDNALSFISKSESGGGEGKERLPSAEDILVSSSKPAFLKQDEKADVDWDALVKDKTKGEEEPISYSTNAITPPKTYDPVSEPLKPTIGDVTTDKGVGQKRPSSDAETNSGEPPKKTKGDNS